MYLYDTLSLSIYKGPISEFLCSSMIYLFAYFLSSSRLLLLILMLGFIDFLKKAFIERCKIPFAESYFKREVCYIK